MKRLINIQIAWSTRIYTSLIKTSFLFIALHCLAQVGEKSEAKHLSRKAIVFPRRSFREAAESTKNRSWREMKSLLYWMKGIKNCVKFCFPFYPQVDELISFYLSIKIETLNIWQTWLSVKCANSRWKYVATDANKKEY